MGVHDKLAALVGDWKGTNKLYLSWMPDPLRESDSSATVSLRMDDQFLEIAYKWSYEGKPQGGMLILGCDKETEAVQAVWTDSWHQNKLMLCDGSIAGDGSFSVKGYYSVPDHPDWGWRTEITPGTDRFRYVMYNVSPEGAEELAVETDFSRA